MSVVGVDTEEEVGYNYTTEDEQDCHSDWYYGFKLEQKEIIYA